MHGYGKGRVQQLLSSIYQLFISIDYLKTVCIFMKKSQKDVLRFLKAMKYSEASYNNTYPNAETYDEPTESLMKVRRKAPCYNCGQETAWLHISFAVHVCCEECRKAIALKEARKLLGKG